MRKRQTQQAASALIQLLDIPEVARRLNIGRTKVYRLIRNDGLPSVQVGKATRVSEQSLQRWIEQHEQAS